MDRLKINWVNLSQFVQNTVVHLLTLILYRKNTLPKKILIFRTGSIGDTICAFPSLYLLRRHFHTSQIHILTTAGGKNLVSMGRLLSAEYYDRIIDYESMSAPQLFRFIRKEKYDLVVELPQNMVTLRSQIRNIFFFRLAGISSGWGWQIATCLSFRQTQERLLHFQQEGQRLKQILADNGVSIDGIDHYPLNISEEDHQKISIDLKALLPDQLNNRKLIAVVPGAKRPQNRYPLDRFCSLAEWIVERGYTVVVIGGPEDAERGEALSKFKSVFSFCGKLTPIQSAALFSRCIITVSNDTGPMHLSYAAGTPVVGIFSSRDFQDKWFPPAGNQVLRNDKIHCSLCLSETCADNICMKGISLDQIKEAFVKLERQLA